MYDDKNNLDPLGLETDVIFDDESADEENKHVDAEGVADAPAADNEGENSGEAPDAENTAECENSGEAPDAENTTEGENSGEAPDAENTTEGENSGEASDAENTTEGENSGEASDAETTAEEEAKPDDKFLTEYPKEEFEKLIYAHFRTVANAINSLRTKEDSITRLSKEVQKYREDYCTKSIKPIAMSLIALRESCRKSLSSLDKPMEFSKIGKFINYLADDMDDLLSDVGLSCSAASENLWVYNGTPICKHTVEKVTFPEVFELVESEPLVLPDPGDSLTEYLAGCEEVVRAALATVEKYDNCIKDYVKVAGMIDEGILAANVYPVLRNLARFAPRFKADVVDSINVLTEENALDEYKALLESLCGKLGELLEMCGVDFEAVEVGSSYDLKKHKIIKLVPTDDASLDRQVITASSDSYTLNDVVISQAKVTVYKYQPQSN